MNSWSTPKYQRKGGRLRKMCTSPSGPQTEVLFLLPSRPVRLHSDRFWHRCAVLLEMTLCVASGYALCCVCVQSVEEVKLSLFRLLLPVSVALFLWTQAVVLTAVEGERKDQCFPHIAIFGLNAALDFLPASVKLSPYFPSPLLTYLPTHTQCCTVMHKWIIGQLSRL